MSPTARAEWVSLSAERDPELRAKGQLNLAGRLEARGEEIAAAAIYATVANLGDPVTEASRHQAAERLAGLSGEGGFGIRAENFLRRFVGQSADPAALFAMGAAGAAFRVTRLACLSRLFAAPGSTFSRGFGARLVSGIGGLGVESLAFPLAGRLANGLLGRELNWSLSVLGREWAGGLIMLGAMRSSGGAMGLAARHWRIQNPASISLLSQTGMLGAIWLALQTESKLGLRPEQGAASSLAEAMATLLHFNVAGRLSQAIFGQGFQRWERGMDHRSEVLVHRFKPIASAPAIQLAFAVDGSAAMPGLFNEAFNGAKPEPSAFPPTIYRDYRFPSGKGGNPIPAIRYSAEGRSWWKQWGGRLKETQPWRSTEEIQGNAVPLHEANRMWRMQIEDFARLVGADFQVHSPERLLDPLGRGFLRRDPALLRRAESLAGEGSEVYELRFPYETVAFGEANERGDYANLFANMRDIASSMGDHVFLAYKAGGQTWIRLPSLELWDGLNQARFGGAAHRMIPVAGAIARDEVMAFREKQLAPLGITRQATGIQDINGKAHSFYFTLHDAFHSTVASTLSPELAPIAGRLYWLAKARLPVSILKEDLLDRFSDLDPGSEYRGQAGEFWKFSLANFWKRFHSESSRDDFISHRLQRYPEFLHKYMALLRRVEPRNPEEAKVFEYISDLLREDSRLLSGLMVEVLRR